MPYLGAGAAMADWPGRFQLAIDALNRVQAAGLWVLIRLAIAVFCMATASYWSLVL